MDKTRRQLYPNEEVLQLKVTLRGSKPSIWRRISVPSSSTFLDLHYTIQIAMGWRNRHLYEFTARATRIGTPDEETNEELLDASKTRLDRILWHDADLARFTYLYDFGDDWYHDIIVENRLLPERVQYYPYCTDGRNACPPEDCGGIEYYSDLIDNLKNPSRNNSGRIREWRERGFDPEAFHLDTTNELLIHIEQAKEIWGEE